MTWSNWSGRQTADPVQAFAPSTETELRAAVAAGAEQQLAVRAVGATHSHSRVAATDGTLITLDDWQGITSLAPDQLRATVRSGTRIFELGAPLRNSGLALKNQGDIDRQSVAGAISTGTHGTGPTLQNLSSSVEALRIILATGDVVDCSAVLEPDLFAVARHSLGGVGLLSEITLGLRPAFRLHERLWRAPVDEVFDAIDDLTTATRHFEFFWLPQGDFCACKSLDEVDSEPPSVADARHERFGWSHEIISSVRDDRHTEMEYAVPAESGPACFREVRAMIQRDFPDLVWPVEYRTVAADDLWISAMTGRASVTISVHQDIALDDRPLFSACEAVFERYDGRPHWGKVHTRTGVDFNRMYSRYADWWSVRDRYDPDGRFVTPYLESLRP